MNQPKEYPIRVIESEAELRAVLPILRELRNRLDEEDFFSLYRAAKDRDQYSLLGFFQGGSCVGLMGVRLLFDFVHGKHLYIDDLVVTKMARSQGIGAQFLRHAEAMARELGCIGLRLCTGIENESGRKFYEREQWTARALAYKKRL